MGRRLVTRFARDHEIVAFDRAPAPIAWPETVRMISGDLRDEPAVVEAARGTEAVVHLGAISGRARHIGPSELLAINVQGTQHVLEAARRADARMVVLASSLCVIGLPDAMDDHSLRYLPVDEAHPCSPKHMYDLTKRLNELQAEAFTRLTGIATVCLRFPMMASAAEDAWLIDHLRLDPPKLVMVDFLDFEDAIQAVRLALGRADLEHEVMFLHSDTAGTACDVRKHLANLTPQVEWRGEPPQATSPLLNSTYARHRLDWSPQIRWQNVLGHAGR